MAIDLPVCSAERLFVAGVSPWRYLRRSVLWPGSSRCYGGLTFSVNFCSEFLHSRVSKERIVNKRDNNARPSVDSSTNHRPSDAEIAARAYDIFLMRGAAPGHDMDDWLQAEQELIERSRDLALLHSMATR